MIGASDNFVRDLKNRILELKIHDESIKNILQDAIEFLSSIFKNSGVLEISKISDFDSKDLCFFLDVYCGGKIDDHLSKCLRDNKIVNKYLDLIDSKWVFMVDLESNIISSGNSHNRFILESYSKRGYVHKIKISLVDLEIKYSQFNKNYHLINFWVFDDGEFEVYEIMFKDINRSKKKQKIETTNGKYSVSLLLNDIGELNSFELTKKKGGKLKHVTITSKDKIK